MAEVSENAALLLATSYQAFQRIDTSDFGEKVCASAVTIIFACIYLEQSIDVIINKLKVKNRMKREVKQATNHNQPSLLEKYIWFCNEYFLEEKDKVKEPFKRNRRKEYIFTSQLDEIIQDFNLLRNLRNDISHGKIDKILPHLNKITELRQSAKNIVSNALDCVNLHDFRNVNWGDTVKRLEQEYLRND